jgi:hypothetical protein
MRDARNCVAASLSASASADDAMASSRAKIAAARLRSSVDAASKWGSSTEQAQPPEVTRAFQSGRTCVDSAPATTLEKEQKTTEAM